MLKSTWDVGDLVSQLQPNYGHFVCNYSVQIPASPNLHVFSSRKTGIAILVLFTQWKIKAVQDF